MNDHILFELDDKEVLAQPGETIWQVAERLGTEIPHLCYKSADSYRADGNCRACMVEIDGERALAASCIRTPTPGMKVTSVSERAKTARRMVMELLVTDQPTKEKRMTRAQLSGTSLTKWSSPTVDFRCTSAPTRTKPIPP